MGLHALGFEFAEIAHRIQERFLGHEWPNSFTSQAAVEIAVVTNGDYAQDAGKDSLWVSPWASCAKDEVRLLVVRMETDWCLGFANIEAPTTTSLCG